MDEDVEDIDGGDVALQNPPASPTHPTTTAVVPTNGDEGGRSSFAAKFMATLEADFDAPAVGKIPEELEGKVGITKGQVAIATLRRSKPDQYVKICAALMPKTTEHTVGGTLGDFLDHVNSQQERRAAERSALRPNVGYSRLVNLREKEEREAIEAREAAELVKAVEDADKKAEWKRRNAASNARERLRRSRERRAAGASEAEHKK